MGSNNRECNTHPIPPQPTHNPTQQLKKHILLHCKQDAVYIPQGSLIWYTRQQCHIHTHPHPHTPLHPTNWKYISSCECNKVVSAFWSFYRRCRLVFKFLLFFIVFRCLNLFIKIKLLWLQTWTEYWIGCFYLKFPNRQKTQFCQNVRYDLVAFTWRSYSVANSVQCISPNVVCITAWLEILDDNEPCVADICSSLVGFSLNTSRSASALKGTKVTSTNLI